jgi:PAS domain S-box-containing protein
MSYVVPVIDTPNVPSSEGDSSTNSAENSVRQVPGGQIPNRGAASIRGQTIVGDARLWLAAVADASEDAIVGKDLNGTVVSWNKAAEATFGFASDEIIGQSITQIIPENRVNEEASFLDRILRGEKILDLETIRQIKDGRTLAVSLTVSPVRDGQNTIVGVFNIVRDLTKHNERDGELRAANVELERLTRHLVKERDRANQANRAKSRFLAGMSHELRTPLNGILGYAELLHMEGGLSATQGGRVEAMLMAGKHLLEMINCVLDLSEIEAEQTEVRLVDCDIQAVACACLDLVRPTAEAKTLALSLAVTPGTRQRVVTEPMRLRQILINLLGNAVKFTSRGAVELRLRTLPDGSTLRIEVTDTGPGVLRDQRRRLFQNFERLEAATVERTEGTGLGLALSARLSSLIGGTLGYAENPSGGSVFWLDLPLNTVAGSFPAAISDFSGPAEQDAFVLHVLIVDDVLMNRDIAASFLRLAGHQVTCAEGGAEAVAAVASTDFDIVLMDIRMPQMDGFEATRRIRALDGDRGRVPVVAMTAQAFTEQVEESRMAGMDGHLSKPFNQATLLAAIARPARNAGRHSATPGPLPVQPTSVIPLIGEELMILNPQGFDGAAGFLATEKVVAHLETIVRDGRALLRDLQPTEAPARSKAELAEAAHKLAGSAGMFGFDRLVAVGLKYESALRSGAADAPVLADALRATIEISLRATHDRIGRMGTAPPKPGKPDRGGRILVVEDDTLQAQILESVLLAAGFEVDVVNSGIEAMREMLPGRYDVVLLDYKVLEINGLVIAKLVNDLMGDVARPVLIALTATPDHVNERETGTKSAFDAVVGKSSDFQALISVIRRCLACGPDEATQEKAEFELLANDLLNYDKEPERPGARNDDPGPPRILLAEDDENQRLLLTAVFEGRGYVVETASDGLEAIRKIRNGCFDLALVDYNLPEMDGMATGSLVLDLMQEHLRPRLIALTSTPVRLHEMMVAGCVFDEVLGKSSDMHGLVYAVDRHLRSSPNSATRRAAARTTRIEAAA